jgi:hypothetical protein
MQYCQPGPPLGSTKRWRATSPVIRRGSTSDAPSKSQASPVLNCCFKVGLAFKLQEVLRLARLTRAVAWGGERSTRHTHTIWHLRSVRLMKTKFSRRSHFSTPRMESAHKAHRAPHAGAKAEKKKAKRNGDSGPKGKNPKAFTMSGKRSTEKQARRSAEVCRGSGKTRMLTLG